MPYLIRTFPELLEQYNDLEVALTELEKEGWQLRFIRPTWHENMGKVRMGAEESFVFWSDFWRDPNE